MPRSDVTIDIKARDAQLQGKLKGVGNSIRAFARRAGEAIKNLNRRFIMLASVIGGISAVAAAKQEQAEKKLTAVLKATGGAAGFTANELRKLASQLQLVTNYGDEVTISAMGILASFKEIKGDIFVEAIQSAQDMSAVMGTDLKSSVVQLGKALNDPIIGAVTLRRVGVTLTEQQMTQIKVFTENNQLMKAQRVILAELKSEFGGAAKEMAQPLFQLKNDLADLAEVIGQMLSPTIKDLAKVVRGVSMAFSEKDSQLRANIKSLGKWALGISGIIIIVPRLMRILMAYLSLIKLITKAET